MARRESIIVSFAPEQAGFLTALVECGEYQSVSEVVSRESCERCHSSEWSIRPWGGVDKT